MDIKLEYLEKEDFYKLIEWNKDRTANYLLQWSGSLYKYPLTKEQINEYFISSVQKPYSNIFIYKVVLVETNEIIGTIELRQTDKDNKIGRICRVLIGEEGMRGKGIGKIVLQEILKIGFNELKFKEITLGVFDFNYNAIRCYESVGFVKEKLIENKVKAEKGYWNIYEMSISKLDWRNKNVAS